MCTRDGTPSTMKEILQQTLSLSRGLDTLQREHQTFITNVATSEHEDFVSGKWRFRLAYCGIELHAPPWRVSAHPLREFQRIPFRP